MPLFALGQNDMPKKTKKPVQKPQFPPPTRLQPVVEIEVGNPKESNAKIPGTLNLEKPCRTIPPSEPPIILRRSQRCDLRTSSRTELRDSPETSERKKPEPAIALWLRL